jgi:hypothetical protein
LRPPLGSHTDEYTHQYRAKQGTASNACDRSPQAFWPLPCGVRHTGARVGPQADGGEALFSGDPDRPTGLAGRVFVSGDAVRMRRSDPLHTYSLAAGEQPAVDAYEGIIAAPLVDWDAGGIPLGVVYVTLAATDGRLFGLPPRTAADPTGQTLDDLFEWLHLSAIGALCVSRKKGRTG